MVRKTEKAWKFHINLFNTDISFDNQSIIIIQVLQDDLKALPEGNVPQNLDLFQMIFFFFFFFF